MIVNEKRLVFGKEQRRLYPETAIIKSFCPEWVKVGNNVIIHENCVLGSQGFGFFRGEDEKWYHIPHIGKVIIEDDVEIFPFVNIDRGTIEDTIIGKGTKIDHHCHIAHNTHIGENCVITAMVMIAGSAKIGNNVWIGPNSSIMNGIKIGNNVYIGQGTNVIKDVPDNVVIVGNPARVLRIGEQPHIKIG